jgi:hypothetical protein
MNKEEENIPNEIFDWLNTHSFQELNANQQAQVSNWFNPTTYNQIHHAAKHALAVNAMLARKAIIKEHILQQFELKNKAVWYKKAIPFWQAAAIIIFLSGIFIVQLRMQKTASNPNLLAFSDTIYLEKLIQSEPIYLYDTVFIKDKKAPKQINTIYQYNNKTEPKTFKNTELPNQVLVQSLHTLESASNQIKGNSLKDDTLLKIYGFVKL